MPTARSPGNLGDTCCKCEEVAGGGRRDKDAGVWVFGGGVNYDEATSVVATDATITHSPSPESRERIGGVMIVEVPSRREALESAAKIAVACRCAQEVREFMYDPAS